MKRFQMRMEGHGFNDDTYDEAQLKEFVNSFRNIKTIMFKKVDYNTSLMNIHIALVQTYVQN